MGRLVYILCLLLVFGVKGSAINCYYPQDSLQLRKDTIIPTPTAFQPDSLIRDSLKYEFTKIKQIASKSSLTKELYKLVFVNPRTNRVNVMRTQRSEDRFNPFKGKKIKSIEVKTLPPYGASVYDTTAIADDLGFIKNIANTIHIKTTRSVLLKQLTVKPNDHVLPFELVQNEILLRQLPFIDDATILISEDKEDEDAVNLIVVCKDDFSWGAEISSNFRNSFRMTLKNKNFASLGHEFEYRLSYRGNKDRQWGNAVQYYIRNAFGSHFDIFAHYQNDYRAEEVWLGLDKQFLTSATKWGGGFMLGRAFRQERLPEIDVRYTIEPFNYYMQDVWLGHSFLLAAQTRHTSNLYVTGRVLNIMFEDRPKVYSDSNQFYYNRINFYSSVVYRNIRYYKANLIFDFGRTEDIPVGFYSGLITGYEKNDFTSSLYLGGEVKYSQFYMDTERYWGINTALASYINKGGPERSVFKAGAHHISNLLSIGEYRWRFYNAVNYVKGFKRYMGDYIYFTDENIVGFDSDSLGGHQKLSVSLATTLFFPFIYKGFRASLTTMLDFGLIADENSALFRSKSYWGIGVSFNLRNDNIVFKNISLRLSYYPNIPVDMRHFYGTMSGRYGRKFYDFEVHKPGIIAYE